MSEQKIEKVKVKILKGCIVEGEAVRKNDVIEIAPKVAKYLIVAEKAEEAKESDKLLSQKRQAKKEEKSSKEDEKKK